MLDNFGFIIWTCSGAGLLIFLFVMMYLFSNKKNKMPKDEKKENAIDNDTWINCLGGAANINNVEAKGSRLIVYVNNSEIINNDTLHELGALSVITAKEKVTIVVNGDAKNIAKLLK